MRDENYYRDKQAKSDARNTVGAIHKKYAILSNAMARLALFFMPPTASFDRGYTWDKYVSPQAVKTVSPIAHRRTLKQRLIRRYKHACKMRNAA